MSSHFSGGAALSTSVSGSSPDKSSQHRTAFSIFGQRAQVGEPPNANGNPNETKPSTGKIRGAACLPAEISPLVIAQLAELFVFWDGFIPPFELVAEGFDIRWLVEQKLAFPPQSHLDFGRYAVGERLRKEIEKQ